MGRLARVLFAIVTAGLIASVLVSPVFPQSLADLVDRVRPSVAFVVAQGPDGGAGSAFVIGSDGLLVTALHVVADGTSIDVRLPGRTSLQADVVAVDVTYDLALLRVNQSDLIPLPLANMSSVRAGQEVVVLGYPLSLSSPLLDPSTVTVTRGIVSALRPPLVQVDAAMNPGNSGGPVLDTTGKVVGMADQGYRGTGLNFAVSADAIALLRGRAPDPSHGPLPPLKVTRTAMVSIVYHSDRNLIDLIHSPELKRDDSSCVAFPPETLGLVGIKGQLHVDGRLDNHYFWLTFDGQTAPNSGLVYTDTFAIKETAGLLKNLKVPKSVCVNWQPWWFKGRVSSFEVTYWLDYKVWSPAVVP